MDGIDHRACSIGIRPVAFKAVEIEAVAAKRDLAFAALINMAVTKLVFTTRTGCVGW